MPNAVRDTLWLSDGDAQFVACRDHVTKREAREYIEAAYDRVRHLLPERDFVARIPREFTSRTWELRIIDWLLGTGFWILDSSLVVRRAKAQICTRLSPRSFSLRP